VESIGLIVDRPPVTLEEYPFVLHAEVRRSGDVEVLASLDVGLSRDGAWFYETRPGRAWTFSSFEPRDAEFYRQELRRLIDAANELSARDR